MNVLRFTGQRQTCFAASDVRRHISDVTPASGLFRVALSL